MIVLEQKSPVRPVLERDKTNLKYPGFQDKTETFKK